MRIGIDGACLSNRRGFGRFARRIVAALAEAGSGHEFVAFVDRPSLGAVELPAGIESVVVDVTEAPSRAASSNGRRRPADLIAMGRAVARSGLDLFYFPATYSYFPVWGVPRVVATMHDTLALSRPKLVFPTRAGRLAWRLKERLAVAQSDRIATVSESARRDLIAWFSLPPARVFVVGEGPDPAFGPGRDIPGAADALRRHGIEPGTPYFLYVGGLSPHKNLPRLIEGFARSGVGEAGARLILVGDLGDVFHTHVPELREAIGRLNLVDRAHLAGFVPDADLAHLYRGAYALVQPSLMEGFGLPPVEAMACGTPVLSSTAGSLPEVVGEAGVYFDPLDPAAIGRAIAGLFADSADRDRLAALALDRAARFTWANAARALLDGFESVAPAGRGRTRARRPGVRAAIGRGPGGRAIG